jgi:hypothetical protein
MISRRVEATSVAKVNKKLLVTGFCIATRAPRVEVIAAQRRINGQTGEPGQLLDFHR